MNPSNRLLFAGLALLTVTTSAYAQKPGDTVTPEALGQIEWVQGTAPTAWEPGKLYVLECWATWCGPCIAAIPHVDALFDKYADKGLQVIGVDVWEDDKDKVIDFVKKKGDGMSYPVAYTGHKPGTGGPFEIGWLKPAEVHGIPHSFLVRDGKVLAMTHPMALTEKIIEAILADGEEGKAALEKLNHAAEAQGAAQKAKMEFSAASAKKDAAGMAAAAEALNAASPGDMYVPLFRNDALVVAKDWAGVEKALVDPETEKIRRLIVGSLSNAVVKSDEVPAEVLAKVTATYEQTTTEKRVPMDCVNLARLYWKAEQKDKALEIAKSGFEIANTPGPGVRIPPVALQKFSDSIEKGSMPTTNEFAKWVQEAQAEKKATEEKSGPAKAAGN